MNKLLNQLNEIRNSPDFQSLEIRNEFEGYMVYRNRLFYDEAITFYDTKHLICKYLNEQIEYHLSELERQTGASI